MKRSNIYLFYLFFIFASATIQAQQQIEIKYSGFLEFKEIGKEPKNLSLDQITKILTEQKAKN